MAKNYFDIAEIFVLRLFNMAESQTEGSWLELRTVVKITVAENCKPCEIYRRMCNVLGEACFH